VRTLQRRSRQKRKRAVDARDQQKYADRLIDDLANVDFLEKIKAQQINWIGRKRVD